MINQLAQEVYKMMKGKAVMETPMDYSQYSNQKEDYTAFAGFLGTKSTRSLHFDCQEWVIDSGSSSHMSSQLSLFENIRHSSVNHTVILPNGNKQTVTRIGDIRLSKDLILKDVLYIQQF